MKFIDLKLLIENNIEIYFLLYKHVLPSYINFSIGGFTLKTDSKGKIRLNCKRIESNNSLGKLTPDNWFQPFPKEFFFLLPAVSHLTISVEAYYEFKSFSIFFSYFSFPPLVIPLLQFSILLYIGRHRMASTSKAIKTKNNFTLWKHFNLLLLSFDMPLKAQNVWDKISKWHFTS